MIPDQAYHGIHKLQEKQGDQITHGLEKLKKNTHMKMIGKSWKEKHGGDFVNGLRFTGG